MWSKCGGIESHHTPTISRNSNTMHTWEIPGVFSDRFLIASKASNHSLGVKMVNKQSQILWRRILKKSVAGLQVLFLAHFSFNLGKITYMSRGSCILYVYQKKSPYFSCLNLVFELINVVLLAPVLTAELTENA